MKRGQARQQDGDREGGMSCRDRTDTPVTLTGTSKQLLYAHTVHIIDDIININLIYGQADITALRINLNM